MGDSRQVDDALRYLRTIRNILMVWSTVTAVAAAVGVLVLLSNVSP